MLSQLINRPCTLVLRSSSTELDAHGNEIPSEDLVASVCEIQQQRRDEPGGEGELSDTRWDAFFPVGTSLTTGDSVEVPGLGTFELTGDPWSARNPRTQVESHVEATLRRTDGPEDAS